MVDDGGDPVVRTDRQEVRRELLVLADVDREDLILHAGLFQHDGDLAAVRGAPGIEIDHGSNLLQEVERGNAVALAEIETMRFEIGRASWRDRGGWYVCIEWVAVQ